MTTLSLIAALSGYFAATGVWLAYFIWPREVLYTAGRGFMAAGWGFHTLFVVLETVSRGFFPSATVGSALVLVSWTLATMFLFFTWRYPVKVLGALVGPLAAIMLCGALILPRQGQLSPQFQSFWLTFHIVAILLGTATFTLAFLGGILYLVQERQLKSRRFGFLYRRLPSLETLDTLNAYCLSLGFPLFTLGLVAGSLYAQHTLGTFWRWDPKETMTLMAWLLYAALLHERLVKGWRGRRAALMAIGGFAILVVTFVGANLGFQSYHSFEALRSLP